MAQYFDIHPENPQQRLIHQVVEILNQGGVIAYPTDSSYALGCHIGDKQALDRIRAIRRVDARHNFTLVCRDLSELSTYAKVENNVYRLLKHYTPGAYTFILKATGEVPRRLQNPKRKTIGLRIPDNNITLALLKQLDQPIMSSTLILPDEEQPLSDPHDIREQLEHQVDLVIDVGFCGLEATTVVDLVSGAPEIIRRGKGDTGPFE
jgi:tRNA threonylcarbamoyl adenosine modification protein (Sua5/YciO/YrdC/YwlC family)